MNAYYLLIIVLMLVGLVASSMLKSRFKKYAERISSSGMNGREVAEKMLRDNNIHGVQVVSVEGALTDHYNPTNKTINLSAGVYEGRSILAAAIAAHETGHAIQHATAYAMLQMRSALVPVVSFSSKIVMFILIGGILMINIFPQLLLIGIVMFAATTLFSFITLPVEFDASRRALVWINSSGIANTAEYKDAKEALWWAATTYVVAALSSLV